MKTVKEEIKKWSRIHKSGEYLLFSVIAVGLYLLISATTLPKPKELKWFECETLSEVEIKSSMWSKSGYYYKDLKAITTPVTQKGDCHYDMNTYFTNKTRYILILEK